MLNGPVRYPQIFARVTKNRWGGQKNVKNPQCDVSSDDTEEPLMPSHLLIGRRILSIPNKCATTEEDETDVQHLTRRQHYLSELLGQFWNVGNMST